MPIYEPDLSYEDMKKAEGTFKCAKCGSPVHIAWSAGRNCYMLKCGNRLEHEGLVLFGRDPWTIEVNARLRGGPELMETKTLMNLTPEQMVARVNQARFPNTITSQERRLIAKVALEYGLDPVFGELMIYQGRPYITIDARRRKAQETDLLDGISARPATREERLARKVPDEDYLFIAEVWVKGASHPFTGTGRVKETELKGDSHLPVVKDPAAQAEKRAEAQALRRAFHIPLPSFEEILEEKFEEIPDKREAPKSKAGSLKTEEKSPGTTSANHLTQAQKDRILGDASKMGYSEVDIQGIIKTKFRVESLNDLSIAAASELIGMISRGEGIAAPDEKQAEEDIDKLWPGGEGQ